MERTKSSINEKMARQKRREVLFVLLFSREFSPEEAELVLFLVHELKVAKKIIEDACALSHKIFPLFEEIDAKIASVSQDYALDRIARVERTVLRLAIYELFYDKMVPVKVIFAEALRLVKKFSVGESSSFIHAILDALVVKDSSHDDLLAFSAR